MIRSRQEAAYAVLSLLCVLGILVHFHDQFWWPVDEGVYAYVAQRANAGDILHRDLVDLHSGYGNIINALAFRMFGEDLLSLRYPLVLIAVLQCGIAFLLLREHKPSVAFSGTLAVAAFSFVQFPNPSANWHALGAFFMLALVLHKMPPGSALRLFLAGTLVGACFFTRQLSGVFLGIGLVVVLLTEASGDDARSRWPGLLIGGTFAAALMAYLVSKQHPFGLIWGGAWPVAILIIVAVRTRIGWAEAGRITGLVVAGVLAAGLPVAALAAWDGALSYWATDIFFTALMINGQSFIADASYGAILKEAVQNILGEAGPVAALSGVMWVFLVLSVPVVGLWGSMCASCAPASIPPTVLLAIVWATGALHYQIPIYLFFVLPATLLALLMLRPGRAVSLALVLVSGWALAFQAGQPLERGLAGIVAGTRAAPNVSAELPRVSLHIPAEDAALFREVLAAIEKAAAPGAPLMTLPMDPQLNFMTGRPAPVRYYGTVLGLRTAQDVVDSIAALDAAAPLLVVHRREDKYFTKLSAELLERIAEFSGRPDRIGPFDLYRYQGAPQLRVSAPER